MSFFTESLAVGRSTSDTFIGPDVGSMVSAGNFVLRLTTLNAIEMKTLVGTETVEFYQFSFWGAGALEGLNGNAVVLNSTTWTTVDTLILTDGSTMVNVWVTPTDPTNTDWFEFKIWHPTLTKVAMSATRIAAPEVAAELAPGVVNTLTLSPTNTLSHSLLGAAPTNVDFSTVHLVHHHRLTLGDQPVVNVFNGNTYLVANGWIPRICGKFLNVGALQTYTDSGLNWRITAAGTWELYGGTTGGVESWIVDLLFLRQPISTVRRYGTFN